MAYAPRCAPRHWLPVLTVMRLVCAASDTVAAVFLGAALGGLWGAVDPWQLLLQAGSPVLSVAVATAFTAGLLCLMLAVRQAVPPVARDVRSYWYANALGALPEEKRDDFLTNPRRQLKPRNLKSKIPMLVTVWSTLAITGLYPLWLPSVASEPMGAPLERLLQTAVGLGGLGGVMLLKDTVKRALAQRNLVTGPVRAALKGLTYVAICVWCFLASQLTYKALRRLIVRLLAIAV